jgi:hypothetical protein
MPIRCGFDVEVESNLHVSVVLSHIDCRAIDFSFLKELLLPTLPN